MALDFLGVPLIISSFLGSTLYPPVPGSLAVNSSRHIYNAFLQEMQKPENLEKAPQRFIEWARVHKVVRTKPGTSTRTRGRFETSADRFQHRSFVQNSLLRSC